MYRHYVAPMLSVPASYHLSIISLTRAQVILHVSKQQWIAEVHEAKCYSWWHWLAAAAFFPRSPRVPLSQVIAWKSVYTLSPLISRVQCDQCWAR